MMSPTIETMVHITAPHADMVLEGVVIPYTS